MNAPAVSWLPLDAVVVLALALVLEMVPIGAEDFLRYDFFRKFIDNIEYALVDEFFGNVD